MVENNNFNKNEISILDILLILGDYKKPICIFSIAVALISGISTNFIDPVYRATTTVTSADAQQNNMGMMAGLGGIAGLAGINLNSQSSDTQTSLAIYKSRRFIEEYIDDENLLPILFNQIWDKESKSWKGSSKPNARSGYGVYKKNLLIREKGPLFDITLSGSDPDGLAEMLNDSIMRINAYTRNEKIKEAKTSIEYLQKQIESTSVNKSQDFLYNLIEEQTKAMMLANSREEYVFKVIDPAIVPTSKVSPIMTQYMILGFFFSLTLACFFVLIVRIFRIDFLLIKKHLLN